MANKQIMTLGQLRYVVSLRQAEVRAVCACGHPVAGIVIKDGFNAQESGRFLAGAYRDHLKSEGAWEHPEGHALSLEIEHLDTEVRGPLNATLPDATKSGKLAGRRRTRKAVA